MSNRFLKSAIFAFSFFLSAQFAFAQMSDEKVIDYVQQGIAAGKSQKEIGQELLAKGVSPAQIKRLMAQYQNSNTNDDVKTDVSGTNRMREDQIQQETGITYRKRGDQTQQETGITYRKRGDENRRDILNQLEIGNEENEVEVFGHNVFSNENLTFAANPNIATPKNYKLGPGDEVYIDIWGESEDRINQVISPEGSITISQIGPVYLNGLTVDQANKYLKQLFSSKYAGMQDEETQINLTLGNIRSISINVMGEVVTPGTLILSPFSTVFSALHLAGGIKDLGTIRNIQVMRDGKLFATIDLYDYLFKGKQSIDIRLQEGDVIVVPTNTNLVNVLGNVKRPMYYEILPNESIAKLIEYAGGFAGNAYTEMVTVTRNNNLENEMYNVPSNDFSTFFLKEGDEVTVGQINDRFQNRVELRGAVLRPGFYAIDNEINSIGKLLLQTEGLLEDAFMERILIYRQTDDLSLEIIPVNVKNILAGKANDIPLRRNDMIVVLSTQDIFDQGTLSITGPVITPGTYPYASNITIEDLILIAGGLQNGASMVRADVARRVNDPYATEPSQDIAYVYSFSIQDGLVVDGDKNFQLQPYDIVQLRYSPGYIEQKIVTINGEVVFGGQYVLQKRNERISDIIGRCGGLTPDAYAKGASLIRKMTEDEIIARDQSLKLSKDAANDSISTENLFLSNTYAVGINLEAALNNPGSNYDVVLKDGDVINIPEFQSTVKIAGDVMNPTVTTFIPGKKAKFYVEKAGGYGERARKNKAFIVYMNGQVEKIKGSTVVEPGSQIIVPSKPESNGTNWQQIITITSGFATLSTMAATLYNIFK